MMVDCRSKRTTDPENEDHLPERRYCALHETHDTDISDLKNEIRKKVSYTVFSILVAITMAVIGTIFGMSVTNWSMHSQFAEKNEVVRMEDRLNAKIDNMKEDLVYEIRDMKHINMPPFPKSSREITREVK